MIIKVCGISSFDQFIELRTSAIDWVGFNFYQKSKRYCQFTEAEIAQIKTTKDLIKVGVFVNETLLKIIETAEQFQLDFIQLHGDETPTFCEQISQHYPVIKAFGIQKPEDINQLSQYKTCTYFLLDTKSAQYGGTGIKFDWALLGHYDLDIPFIIAGGIGPNDVDAVQQINHPKCKGIDINSKFELSPGIKNLDTIYTFLKEIK